MPQLVDAGGYELHGPDDGPEYAPYPPYVQTPEERTRWDASASVATSVSKLYEASGNADPGFVWHTTRALYNSDMPTGLEEDVQEARTEDGHYVEGPANGSALAARRRAYELYAIAQTRKPSKDEASAERWHEYTHALMDVLDGALGPADEFLPSSYYTREVAEAATFAEQLHPRSRVGKWTEKLGAVMQPPKHPEAKAPLKPVPNAPGHTAERAKRVASDAERLAARANETPHALHEKALAASQDADRDEKSKRASLSTMRQRLLAAVPDGPIIPVGRAQAAIHAALTKDPPEVKDALEKAKPRKDEPVTKDAPRAAKGVAKAAGSVAVGWEGDPRDVQAGGITAAPLQTEDAKLLAEHADKLTAWVAEHADLIHHAGMAARLAGGIAQHVLQHADDDELTEGAAMKGAMIALYPDLGTAHELAVDDGEDPEQLHVTLKYLGEDHEEMGDKLKGQINHALEQFAKDEKPLEGQTGDLDTFKPNDGEYPVVVKADVPGLHEFRQRLVDALPAGVMDDTHPTFKPHVTLKYVPEGEKHDVRVKKVPLRFGEVHAVFGGEKTTFPLQG